MYLTYFHEPLFKVINLDIVADAQSIMQKCDFLLITSMNAVRNLKYIDIPVLAVGEKLADFIVKKFDANVICVAKNAQDLYKFIVKNDLKEEKILYLRGEDITFDFKQKLPNLMEVITYKVLWKNDFGVQLIELLKNQQIKNIFFYSQGCARHFLFLAEKNFLLEFLEKINVYSLSKDIADVVNENPWAANFFCDNELEMISILNKNNK